MTRALRLLLLISVFLCGLHAAEPVQAHDQHAHHELSGADAGEDAHTGAEQAAHAVHHHCPMAPDQASSTACGAPPPDALGPFARPAAALASRSQAPPLEPPAA